jgi:ribonuclease P protein 3
MGGILGTTATMAEPEHEQDRDQSMKSGYNSTGKRKVTNEEPCSKKQRLEETPATLAVAVAAAAAAAPIKESTTTTTTAATAIATVTSIDPVVNRGGKSRHNNKTTSKQNNRKNNNKIKTKHMDPRILKVRKEIQEGCRTNNLYMAMLSYEEAIKDNIRIEAQSYYNLLNLCDGLDREERGLHVGSPKLLMQIEQVEEEQQQEVEKPSPSPSINIMVDLKKRQEYIFKIKDRMQSTEINLPLNETAYSAILKILSKNKEFSKAEEILNEAELVQQCKPKLRLYSSLLYAYCEYDYNNDKTNDSDNKPNESTKLVDALLCWKRLRQRAKIMKQIATKKATSSTTSVDTGMELTEREYLSLMKCAISYNDTLVMEDVLSRLAEDIPIPCKNSISIIIEWFTQQNRTMLNYQNQNNNATVVQQLLDEIRTYDTVSEPSPRMGPVGGCGGSRSSWSISNKCSIDIKTGILTTGCLKGYTLQPVPLSDSSFNDMIKMNELIVVEGQISGHASKFQGGKKGKKRNNNNNKDQFSQQQQRQREWNHFNDFLSSNCSTTNSDYDVVIDGANIGYYKQNFMNSPHHVNYEQIDWIVRYFTYTLNKRVLLVMHNRHFTKRMLPSKYQYIIDFWMNNNILYQTPAGMNDDWFWMHAALKYKSLVVTNDEMRDHHFQMLAPKFFLRWKERHQIHFDFGNPLSKINIIQQMQQQQISIAGQQQQQQQHPHSCSNSRNWHQREIILKYPNVYSRRIQRVGGGGGGGLVVPLTMVGDENRFLDGCHVASDEESAEELYLCICPNIV